jgi:hypothetical protein
MKPFDPIIFHQLPVIQKIIEDETWLEGERRGAAVSPDDPVVRENVCLVLLRIGEELRASIAVTGPALDQADFSGDARGPRVGTRRKRSRLAA